MKKVHLFLMFAILGSIIILQMPSNVQAQTPAMTNALSWINSVQSLDGNWGSEVTPTDSVQATAAVLVSLTALDSTTSPGYVNATGWLTAQQIDATRSLAERLLVFPTSSADRDLIVSYLDDVTRAWGGYDDLTINNLDTALALQALKSANYSDTSVIDQAISYLTSNQNTDGGWAFVKDDSSNTYMTAIVSSTLQQFTQTTTLASALNKATQYLIAHQNLDGGFGDSSTVYETSLAYLALINATTDGTVLGNAVNFLTVNQSSNGSWNDDPYSTALALQALNAADKGPATTAQPPVAIEPENTAPSATSTTVSGKVIDSATGTALQSATVMITGTDLSAVTASDGTYTINNVSTLDFSVRAVATSHDSLTYTASTTGFGAFTVDFSLQQTPVTGAGMISSFASDKAAYSAFANANFEATLTAGGNVPTNVSISIQILDSKRNLVTVITPELNLLTVDPSVPMQISLSWNIVQALPGDYTALLSIYNNDNDNLEGEREIPIVVLPTTAVSDSRIKLAPTYVYFGSSDTLDLSASYANRSNIDASLDIEYQIKTPSGAILASGTAEQTFTLDKVSLTTALAKVNGPFNESGGYPIDITIRNGETVLEQATATFTVLPNLHMEATHSVSPGSLLPTGTGKVSITIEVKGVDRQ